MFRPNSCVRLTATAAVTVLLAFSAPADAAPLNIVLGFSSLPSAQGWTYVPTGAHAGVVESTVFSVGGGVLTMNTMGQSNGVSGGSIFYQRLNGVTTSETKQIGVSMRCLQVEGSANATLGQGGLFFGFTTGSQQYGFGITPTKVFTLQAGGQVVGSGTFDNTQYHDYAFNWSPGGSFTLYRDAVLVQSGSTGFSVAANRVFFGDGTGGANANAQIKSYRFVQDLATPAAPTSWGRLKQLYR